MAERPDRRSESSPGETLQLPNTGSHPASSHPSNVPPTRAGSASGENTNPPTQLGRYLIHREIGRGGMGMVLHGHDPILGRDLALKVLLPHHGDHGRTLLRFQEEAQIGGQLQHPGLVPVYELGTDSAGQPFFAMKLVEGQTLDALLKARANPSEDLSRFLSIFEQVGQAVGYAHSRGVLHRDLKPANIMVGAFGEVQVMDWGLAKVLGLPAEPASTDTAVRSTPQTVRTESTDQESMAGSILGTPAYMPPEQARGEVEKLDTRADVFGLGGILCEILTGSPPYIGRNTTTVMERAMKGDLVETMARLEDCGAAPELVQLARACLDPLPDNRPRDGGAVAEGVATYLASVQARYHAAEMQRVAAEVRVQEAQQRVRAERRARRLTVGLVTTVLLTVILGGAGFAWFRQQRLVQEARQAQIHSEELAKATRLEQSVQSDLDQADQARRAGKLNEARVALERAEGRLTAGGDNTDLRARLEGANADLEKARKDQQMIERLDQARVLAIAAGDPDAEGGGQQLYRDAFVSYGINMESLSAADAAERIRACALREEMITALDGWARFYAFEPDKVSRKGIASHLHQVAELADDEGLARDKGWARRLRAALRGNNKTEVLTLAEAPEAMLASASSCLLLSDALVVLNRKDRSIEILEAGRRLHPGDFWITMALGRAFLFNVTPARNEEAVRYLTAAVSLRPEHAPPHVLLARALKGQRRYSEAILAYQEGLRLKPSSYAAHNGLGEIYLSENLLDEAIAEFREVIRLGTGFLPVAHYDLGRALSRQGNFTEALVEYQKCFDISEALPEMQRNCAQGITEARQLVELEGKLPDYLSGKLKPTGAEQQVEVARLCSRKGKFVEAVAFFRAAFASQPGLATPVNAEPRYEAACAAIKAAVGRGGEPLSDKDRAALHREAAAWLRVDVTTWTKRLANDRGNNPYIQSALRRWQHDERLAPVRDEAALAQLGEEERMLWQKFWKDVDTLYQRVTTGK